MTALGNDVQSLEEEKTIHVHGLGIEELALTTVHIPNSLGDFQEPHRRPDIEPLTWSSDCLVSCNQPPVKRL